MELLKTYRRSLAEFTDRVEQVHPGQWSATTPCPGWDVRTLVNHVVNEERWSVPLLAGRTIDEVGDRYDGDQLGADPIQTAREAAAQAEVAATSPGTLDRTVHLSAGATSAEEYLHQLLAEHLVHGWDLAVAIGADPTMDADAVAEAARWYSRHVEDYRSNGLVQPEVELPAGAGEQDRLLAAFGRDPDWAP
ncbi:TIGR03086 family metal-binding protein [Verrucosispora sp. WMMD703]|uniref:TIGR03086 family protein n=1 Tax=Micromonospora sediminimaris TaxID=547162 RepID=A0A9W5XN25_9ACTN|nr:MULTISPECIES: TIGR03086 family metal-binding protein [Micromonospora]WFE44210.1 TIGR03086 family metal-binding protein [Verrucosispora sp. WMMD1129]GIJ35838.1 TIGR03086 family protein [Micromonospora sediminimaris]SFC50885.1 TIGR03086 family protein [Micromonospora sediminimaris]